MYSIKQKNPVIVVLPKAKQYQLSSGGDSSNWIRGFAETRQSVVKLSGFIVDSLLRADVSAVAVSLFPSVSTLGKNVICCSGVLTRVFELALKGFVPVIHGDAVLDDQQTCSIFGGDAIVHWLYYLFRIHSHIAYQVDSILL